MHFKNAINLFAEKEVREADNAGASFGRTVDAARRHCGDAVDELGFAYGRQSKIAAGGIHGVALQIDGRENLVAVIGVGEKLIEQISRPAIPEVMMRIDDRQIGRENLFAPPSKPSRIDREKKLLDGILGHFQDSPRRRDRRRYAKSRSTGTSTRLDIPSISMIFDHN